MAEVAEIKDPEFEEQMLGLVHEAELALHLTPSDISSAEEKSDAHGARDVVQRTPEPSIEPTATAGVNSVSLAESLRPLLLGLQAMSRTSGEHGQILSRLDKVMTEQTSAVKEFPRVVADLRSMTDQRGVVSKQMFDALHDELKSYKDGFLLDTVHRPLIRDLITLFDDLTQIHQQMRELIEASAPTSEAQTSEWEPVRRLESVRLHVEHNLDFILEVLARLEVSLIPSSHGKLDKKTQRAVSVSAAEDPDDDLTIVRVLKRGFYWKERVVRAEEVIVRKWKEGFLMALKSADE